MRKSKSASFDNPFQVGSAALPPWDRQGGHTADLSDRVGSKIAVGNGAAARLLGTKKDYLSKFLASGILKDGRIVERNFGSHQATFICIDEEYWSRLYLQIGEIPTEVDLDDPSVHWKHGDSDVVERRCICIRGSASHSGVNITITTNRRVYRIRAISHRNKVTIGCNWLYPLDQPDGSLDSPTPPGARRRWFASERTGLVTRFALFPLGASLKHLVIQWAQSLLQPCTADLNAYKKLRRLADISSEEAHPDNIIDAILFRLLEVGTISAPEVRQWIELPTPRGKTVEDLKLRATGLRRQGFKMNRGERSTLEDMQHRFPFLSDMPETCLTDAEAHPAPPEAARRVALGMEAMADHAAFFCFCAARYYAHSALIVQTTRLLSRLEALASRAGLPVSLDGDIDPVIRYLLTSPDCEAVHPSTKLSMVHAVLFAIRTMRRFVRHHPSARLERYCPKIPSSWLTTVAADLRRAANARYRLNRKARVDRHAGRLSELQFAADLNFEQVVITNQTLLAAQSELGDADYIDVPVILTIVDQKGRLLDGKQQTNWRIWKREPFCRSLLHSGLDQQTTGSLRSAATAHWPDANGGYIHEYRGIEGLLGSRPIIPFFVRCWMYGLIANPALLPARVRHKRSQILRQLKLPGKTGGDREGLFAGEDYQMDVWRASLRQHRVIAFLPAFEHALRFAHLGMSSVLENLSRATAWMQQTQDQSGWDIRRLNGRPTAGFLAIDKQSNSTEVDQDMTWFPVGTAHLRMLSELTQLTCERCGYLDGKLPQIRQPHNMAWKRADHQPWVFSFSGNVLKLSELQAFLRFLLPGFGDIKFHDLRHLGANAAFEAGVPGWMIRLTLNHSSSTLWEYYSQLTDRQLRALEDVHVRTVFERGAAARTLEKAA